MKAKFTIWLFGAIGVFVLGWVAGQNTPSLGRAFTDLATILATFIGIASLGYQTYRDWKKSKIVFLSAKARLESPLGQMISKLDRFAKMADMNRKQNMNKLTIPYLDCEHEVILCRDGVGDIKSDIQQLASALPEKLNKLVADLDDLHKFMKLEPNVYFRAKSSGSFNVDEEIYQKASVALASAREAMEAIKV